jgi:hypothetical protein
MELEGPDGAESTHPVRVVVAAYYDLTSDELAQRIPVTPSMTFATDPSISRLPVVTVPALDSR